MCLFIQDKKGSTLLRLSVLLALMASAVLFYTAYEEVALLPRDSSRLQWFAELGTDTQEGGQSVAEWGGDGNEDVLDFSFLLGADFKFPYASANMVFAQSLSPDDFLDLSGYEVMQFDLACEPQNALSLSLYSFDSSTYHDGQFGTLRPSVIQVDCDSARRRYEIALDSFSTPDWWLSKFDRNFSDRASRLQQVHSLAFISSSKSEVGVSSRVVVSSVILRGWNRFLLSLGFATFALALSVIIALFGWPFVLRWAKNNAAGTLEASHPEYIDDLKIEAATTERADGFVSGQADGSDPKEADGADLKNADGSTSKNAEGSTRKATLAIDDAVEVTSWESESLNYQTLNVEVRADRDKQSVLTFISKEYANPDMSLDLMVSTLGLNRSKVNNILRDQFGMTFSAYLNRLRLMEAARLLREKDVRVAEVGYLVGYNNPSYFSRVFKKAYGCTPGVFRSKASEPSQTAFSGD